MVRYNSFDELHSHYNDMFGSQWERIDLTEEQHWNWITACYELYPKEFEQRNLLNGVCDDEYDGRPFVILSPILNDEEWDLEALPAYNIKFTDNGDLFQAYPEEIFVVY